MTHQKNNTGIELALEEIISNGFEGLESAVSLLVNEASLLRLVSAILIEISEEWETGRTYMRMDGFDS